MPTPPVLLDPRTDKDFFNHAIKLAQAYCPDWNVPQSWPSTNEPTNGEIASDPGLALLKLFSSLANYLAGIENGLPRQRQLALYRFLDMTLRTAAPAGVPLQFTLAQNRPAQHIPKGAAVLDTATQAIRFETDTDVDVIPASLGAALTVAPIRDRYTDVLAATSQGEVVPLLPSASDDACERWLEHCLILGDSVLFKPDPSVASLRMVLRGENLDPNCFSRWYDGALNALECTVAASVDRTYCSIELAAPQADTLSIADLHRALCAQAGRSPDAIALTAPGETMGFWLVARPAEGARVVPALTGNLPKISSVSCELGVTRSVPQQTSFAGASLDISNGAYPLGRMPVIDDAFYVRCDNAFAYENTWVDLTFELRALGDNGNAVLEWQFWNGERWTPFVDSGTGQSAYRFSDTTQNLAVSEGHVTFICPDIAQRTVAGSVGYWIRAVLAAGGYASQNPSAPGYNPPFVRSLCIDYDCAVAPAMVWRHNAFMPEPLIGAPFEPYRPLPADWNGSYLGLAFASDDLLQGSWDSECSIYFDIAHESARDRPPTQWQWLAADGMQWNTLDVFDGTAGFSRSGVVRFRIPSGIAEVVCFAQRACWYRVARSGPSEATLVRGIYANAAIAHNLTGYADETLGSSNGLPDQSFLLSHAGVQEVARGGSVAERNVGAQPDIEIDVIEPAALDASLGGDPEQGVPVAWQCVESFVNRKPDERVFTLDARSGRISFGDSRNGMIPPAGVNNVIARRYTTTHGSAGNLAARSITLLRPGISGVASVVNPIAASGGVDGDLADDLLDSGPSRLRANERAVALPDLEALCAEVSGRVCRARAIEVTLEDVLLRRSADFGDESTRIADLSAEAMRSLPRIDLYVLPVSDDREPISTADLLNDVAQRLQERCSIHLSSRVAMRSAKLRRIDVRMVLQTSRPPDGWRALESLIVDRLTAYLHPVQGGADKKGWSFGEAVRVADVSSFLQGLTELGDARLSIMTLCDSVFSADVPRDAVAAAGTIAVTIQAS